MRSWGKLGLALGLIVGSQACAVTVRSTASPDRTLVAVLRAESNRDGLEPALRSALVDRQPRLRVAGLRALARIEETGTAGLATPLLADPDEDVARWAAFAAGQIGDSAAEAALRQALPRLSVTPEAVLRALGRAGTATAARDLHALLRDERPDVRREAAYALGLIAKRLGAEVPAAQYTPRLVALLEDPEPSVRAGATYALMRMPGPDARVGLIRALEELDPEVRANAARGLGAAGAHAAALDPAVQDADWRVRVEAARALGALVKQDAGQAPHSAQRLLGLLGKEVERFSAGGVIGAGLSTHVLLAIVEATAALGEDGRRVLEAVEAVGWSTPGRFGDALAGDAARIHCAWAREMDARDGAPSRLRGCGNASLRAWRRTEAEIGLLAAKGEAAIPELLRLATSEDVKVRAAAVAALSGIESPAAGEVALKLLGAADPYVVGAAAGVLAERPAEAPMPPGALKALRTALDVMLALEDGGYAVPILDALGALGERARSALPRLESLREDPRPAVRRRAARARERITGERVVFAGSALAPPYRRPGPVGGRPRLRLETNRGEVLIELYGDVAPRITGVLVGLARSGFYDGLLFHRVVSDFVVQGGCPRGDGWGGPGYTVEDETSPLPFVRGAVGIATSGRDTGGSQFFIMHSAHPHLDGGYSVVGRVLEGMEVVDALQVDDRILRAQVEATRGNDVQ